MPTSKGMGDGGCAQVEMASFRVAEFSDVLDWRPMLFQEPIIAQRACALCGVMYKRAIRLPCTHTLCVKCHARCVDEGSACPVDQEPFCEDDVEKLEVSAEYILKRKVACWNAPRGCGFVGPAASLLDHYKECDFNIVPCCLCHSSVMRNNILDHFRNGCSSHQAASTATNGHATQDLEDIGKAYLEMKKAIGKISEDLVSLQSSLNHCSEDVRAEGARCKAEASRLSEQLKDLSTVCTTGFTTELQALQAAMTDYKEHVSKGFYSLRDTFTSMHSGAVSQDLRCHCRPKKVHWYIEQWENLKKQALEDGIKSFESPTRIMHDYSVSQSILLEQVGNEVHFGCFMCIHPGVRDSELEWPFCKVYTVGVVHPKDKSNVISNKINPSEKKDTADFQRPKNKKNLGRGARQLSTVEELERDGFIQNDTLHVFLEMEP